MGDLALVLLDTALINSGFHMGDSQDFSQRMYRVMKTGLGLKSLDLADHIEIPKEPETSDDDGEEDEEDAADGGDKKEEKAAEEKAAEPEKKAAEPEKKAEPAAAAKDESAKDEL